MPSSRNTIICQEFSEAVTRKSLFFSPKQKRAGAQVDKAKCPDRSAVGKAGNDSGEEETPAKGRKKQCTCPRH
jgi:hypothetical protein